jgi:hypothetical protein
VSSSFLGLTAAPLAAEGSAKLTASTIEVGVPGGFSATFSNDAGDRETVSGYHGLLRFGAVVVADEHGPGILRGHFEIGVQPMYIRLDEQPATNVYGAAFVMRWLFAGNGTLRPHVEGARACAGPAPVPARPTAGPTSSWRAARASGSS